MDEGHVPSTRGGTGGGSGPWTLGVCAACTWQGKLQGQTDRSVDGSQTQQLACQALNVPTPCDPQRSCSIQPSSLSCSTPADSVSFSSSIWPPHSRTLHMLFPLLGIPFPYLSGRLTPTYPVSCQQKGHSLQEAFLRFPQTLYYSRHCFHCPGAPGAFPVRSGHAQSTHCVQTHIEALRVWQ